MNKTRLIPITILLAIAMALIAAPGAQADTLSCTTSGRADLSPGVQGVVSDLADGDILDTDNDVSHPNAGWEDGTYEYFDLVLSLCMAVDTNGPLDDGFIDTGLYTAIIHSFGAYDNVVCGSAGVWTDRRFANDTTVTLIPLAALGPGERITDADYQVTFSAGSGPMVISSATNSSGETMSGGGWVRITPVDGNCVTTDVTAFAVEATFTLAGP